jgi:hypothetical protein
VKDGIVRGFVIFAALWMEEGRVMREDSILVVGQYPVRVLVSEISLPL